MRYLILPLVLTCLEAQAATVVVDSNISLTVPIGGFEDYELTVQQNPVFDDNPTGIVFDRDGLTRLRFVNHNIDEGSDWYLANLGDSFSKETIESDSFVTFFSASADVHNVIDVGFSEFYLGVNTGQGPPVGGFSPRDVFGWAKFRNSPSGLELLESAVAYQTDGIIIGTTTTIPEPSSLLLVVICGACLIVQRKCSKMTRRGVY